MVCTDPAMCECVWLMIAVVCVCRLGMCVGVGVRGGGLEGYVFCCDNLQLWIFSSFLFYFILF